jgi:hypothetical protein
MASLTNLLLLILAIELVFVLTGYTTIPGTSLYQFVSSPSTWDNSGFMVKLNIIVDILLAGVALVGLFTLKTDFIVFTLLIPVLLSFGKGIANLWVELNKASPLLALIFCAPLVVIFVVGVVQWWRVPQG